MCVWVYYTLLILQEVFQQGNHPLKAYIKTLMKYKHEGSAQAKLQGFSKELEKRAWDIDDVTERQDTSLSTEIELFGLSYYIDPSFVISMRI